MRYILPAALLYLALTSWLWCLPAQAADASLLIDILECESSAEHRDPKPGRHGKLHCGDGGISCGIGQFQKPTFERFVRLGGFKNVYYGNAIHQLRVMNWAIDNGYGHHWTCYTKIMNERAAVMDSKTAAPPSSLTPAKEQIK